MKIDSHQYFWKYNLVRDSWITEDMQKIPRDFLPSDLNPPKYLKPGDIVELGFEGLGTSKQNVKTYH